MTSDDEKQSAKFGGPWTIEKLDILEKYLDAYTTALKAQPFNLMYVDVFAGTGLVELPNDDDDDDIRSFVSGSAERAIRIDDKPFDKLIFVEQDPDRCADLENLRAKHSGRNIEVTKSEANSLLRDLHEDWTGWRGVFFSIRSPLHEWRPPVPSPYSLMIVESFGMGCRLFFRPHTDRLSGHWVHLALPRHGGLPDMALLAQRSQVGHEVQSFLDRKQVVVVRHDGAAVWPSKPGPWVITRLGWMTDSKRDLHRMHIPHAGQVGTHIRRLGIARGETFPPPPRGRRSTPSSRTPLSLPPGPP